MVDNIGIRPLFDKIIVKRIEERTTTGGILIPETASDKSQKGLVVAVGTGKYEDGKICPMTIKINDNVLFGKYSGTEINVKGKEYIVMKEEDVIAIFD